MKNIFKSTRRVLLKTKYDYFDNFIFIHIGKTGGTSVKRALNISERHMTAVEKIEEVGFKTWNRKLTFSVVRNPWDRVVSQYHFRMKRNRTNLRTNPVDFKKWIKLTYGEQDKFYYDNPKFFMPQMRWIADCKDVILVDDIIYFEDINNGFDAVLKKIGKNVILPHVNKTNHKDYREYFNDETIGIVRDWYKIDIDKFGYRFER